MNKHDIYVVILLTMLVALSAYSLGFVIGERDGYERAQRDFHSLLHGVCK